MFLLVQFIRRRSSYHKHHLGFCNPDYTSNYLGGYFLGFHCQLTCISRQSVIMVGIDRFPKTAHFSTLSTNFSAFKAAELLTNMIHRFHGYPRNIISDRDLIFLSYFWKSLFKLNGIKLRMSTTYHPQTDGHTEVLNRCLQ